jgi:hypothetical protein
VSPIAFEDLSEIKDVPNGKLENENLQRYTDAMEEVAKKHQIVFVDAFSPSKSWYAASAEPLTLDGSQLNEAGYEKLAVLLADKVFGKAEQKAITHRDLIQEAVMEKNCFGTMTTKSPTESMSSVEDTTLLDRTTILLNWRRSDR